MRLSSDARETNSDQRGGGDDGTDSEHDSGTGREYENKKAKGGEEREGQAELKVKMNGGSVRQRPLTYKGPCPNHPQSMLSVDPRTITDFV